MGKYTIGIAALLALILSGVQTFRIGSLTAELRELRGKAAATDEDTHDQTSVQIVGDRIIQTDLQTGKVLQEIRDPRIGEALLADAQNAVDLTPTTAAQYRLTPNVKDATPETPGVVTMPDGTTKIFALKNASASSTAKLINDANENVKAHADD